MPIKRRVTTRRAVTPAIPSDAEWKQHVARAISNTCRANTAPQKERLQRIRKFDKALADEKTQEIPPLKHIVNHRLDIIIELLDRWRNLDASNALVELSEELSNLSPSTNLELKSSEEYGLVNPVRQRR